MNAKQLVAVTTLLAASFSACAVDQKWSGQLCCNMRSNGSWITDINYDESGKHIIPAGTPVDLLGYGRHRVRIRVENKDQAIGNDYSRDLSDETFAKRYISTDDVAAKIASYPTSIRAAIGASKLTKGMTKEQVLMAVGYPVSSENPHLEAKVWRFWLSSFAEFSAHFDDAGVLLDVDGDLGVKEKVYTE